MGGIIRKLKNDEPANEEKTQSLAKKADSMQEVVKDIFMGSDAAARDKELLLRNNITHILAVGWDLKKHFEGDGDFKYLLLNQIEDRPGFIIIKYFAECFAFMDRSLQSSSKSTKLFVHCHKGLSRSATIIIAYEMLRRHQSFEAVCDTIREYRSFIMPNIGFQAQLQAFEKRNYSTDMADYDDLNIYDRISNLLPGFLQRIIECERLFKSGREDDIDDQDLFQITMYFHQVDMLDRDERLPRKDDQNILNDAVSRLRRIQTDYVNDQSSLARFDKLFHVQNGVRVEPKRAVDDHQSLERANSAMKAASEAKEDS